MGRKDVSTTLAVGASGHTTEHHRHKHNGAHRAPLCLLNSGLVYLQLTLEIRPFFDTWQYCFPLSPTQVLQWLPSVCFIQPVQLGAASAVVILPDNTNVTIESRRMQCFKFASLELEVK